MKMVNDVVISRVFDAKVDNVWKEWTNQELLKEWWGPKMFTNPICEIELRVGGTMNIHMRAPDGKIYPMKGTYKEIIENEKIVFTSIAMDNEGDELFEIMNIIEFADANNKTKLTMTANVTRINKESSKYLDGMEEGWNMSFDKLEEVLSK